MILYSGLVKYNKSGKIQDVIVVSDDFSWKSFFFNPLWLLYHRMWFEALFFIGVIAIFGNFNKLGINSLIIQIAFALAVSLNAKKWYKENLLKRHKYQLVAELFGHNHVEAKLKLINQLTLKSHSDHSEIFSSEILNPQKNKKKPKTNSA